MGVGGGGCLGSRIHRLDFVLIGGGPAQKSRAGSLNPIIW